MAYRPHMFKELFTAHLRFQLDRIRHQLEGKLLGAPVRDFLGQITSSGEIHLKYGQHQIEGAGRKKLALACLPSPSRKFIWVPFGGGCCCIPSLTSEPSFLRWTEYQWLSRNPSGLQQQTGTVEAPGPEHFTRFSGLLV